MTFFIFAWLIALTTPAWAGNSFPLSDVNSGKLTGTFTAYDYFYAGFDPHGYRKFAAQIECAPKDNGLLQNGRCHLRSANGFSLIYTQVIDIDDPSLTQSLITGLLKNGFEYRVYTRDSELQAAGAFVTCTIFPSDEGDEADPRCTVGTL